MERCFEDEKGEIGLDHYEGRRYLGLKRHLIVSAVSHLFLAETRQELGGEKSGADGVPGAIGHTLPRPDLAQRRPMLTPAGRIDLRAIEDNPGAQRGGALQSHQTQNPRFARDRNQVERPAPMSVAAAIAL